MKLTFLGATGTVTGSKYMVEDGNQRVLIDCGLFQGQKELRLRNWEGLSVDPSSIHAVVLTHAHLDHSGYIPLLVKNGFKGAIYCSESTLDLCRILLPDSGYLQEEDAARANRHGYSKHSPAQPLYTEQDARACLDYFQPVEFGKTHALSEFLTFSLRRAGHILGASFVRISDGGTSILFSGDIGRLNDPIMKAPVPIEQADYLVVESTYGDRLHAKTDPLADLEAIIKKTIARGGSVIIPAFAVGRAQSILYYIYRLKAENRLPQHLPVYLDSPMAINASELLQKHLNDHRLPAGLCAKVCDVAEYTRTTEESKALDGNHNGMPRIIISASGMATGGRVLHHLKHYISDPRSTILLAGYQAEGTRGDRLARGEKEIKIHGQMRPVKAEIIQLDNMSAHADFGEILSWLGHFTSPPRKTFVTHGSPSSAQGLKKRIEDTFGWEVSVPAYLQVEEL
jgi:metallo-beta-lactamase family protein